MLESLKIGERAFTFGLSPIGVDTLVDAMRLTRFAPGDVVICEGKSDDAIYLIKRGNVVSKRPQQSKAPGGERSMVPLATLERGELFGEQSLLALSTDKNVKQPKRKTSMVVESEEELICLTATPESLKAVGLQQVRATVHTSHTASRQPRVRRITSLPLAAAE